jgi:hypothetical protein
MTDNQFEIYHVGDLNRDRIHSEELNSRAKEILAQAESGEVVILQKKLSDNKYEYRKYCYRTNPSSRSNARRPVKTANARC